MKMRNVKVIKDATGELPPSLIGRYGKRGKRLKDSDEWYHSASRGTEVPSKAYEVWFHGWDKPFLMWSDEFVLVKNQQR